MVQIEIGSLPLFHFFFFFHFSLKIKNGTFNKSKYYIPNRSFGNFVR